MDDEGLSQEMHHTKEDIKTKFYPLTTIQDMADSVFFEDDAAMTLAESMFLGLHWLYLGCNLINIFVQPQRRLCLISIFYQIF